MQLKYPICLTIIVPILLILFLGIWLRRKNRPTVFVPNLGIFIDIKVSPIKRIISTSFEFLSIISAILVIVFLAITAARPQQKIEQNQSKSGIDIILLLDGSGSMFYTYDEGSVAQSPLESARIVIKNFVSRIEVDRVGLISFSGTAYTLCPLTFDYSIIEYYMDLMTDENAMWFIEGGGTAIGDAIILGTEKFQKDIDRTKIIILITDGEATQGIDPMKAAQYAKDADVKIYSIFVSSSSYSYGYDDLEKISSLTDGKVYKAQSQQALQQVFDDIQNLEKTEIEYTSNTLYEDIPMTFIVLAGLFSIVFIGSRYIILRIYS